MGRALEDTLMADVRALAGLGPRHPVTGRPALTAAADLVARRFAAAGFEVRRLPLPATLPPLDHVYGRPLGAAAERLAAELHAATHENVEAALAGADPAAPAVVLGAHYDTVADSPGADDNATGIAVLLAAADALAARRTAGWRPVRSLRLVAFTLEEAGLLGSAAYVAHLKETRAEVAGALVVEAVGFRSEVQRSPAFVHLPPPGDFVAFVANERSRGLLERLLAAARAAAPRLRTIPPEPYFVAPGEARGPLADMRRSDHAPFWDAGWPAVMLTDTAEFRSPHYHRPTDTPETLDPAFLADTARVVLHALADLAGSCGPARD